MTWNRGWKSSSIAGLILLQLVCSCVLQPLNNGLHIKDGPTQHFELKTGLIIENTPTRGLAFTDTLGRKFGLVYITTTITNDNAIPIQLHTAFSEEYDYPIDYGKEQFKIIILSEEWAKDKMEITDSMTNKILIHSNKSFLDKILEPGKKVTTTIGILRPARPDLCSATPYAILEFGDRRNYPLCEWSMNENGSSNTQLALGLKVGFCTSGEEYKSCTIIPCGQISYP